MFSIAMFLFMITMSAAAAARVLGIAAAVYTVLQVTKKIFPSIGGPWALVFNIALSILGFLVTVPASDLLSLTTLTGLITVVAAAAGIHGTVKNLTAPSPA